ncbi:MAG: lipoyl synthase [Nitrosopumilaceae archaeon]
MGLMQKPYWLRVRLPSGQNYVKVKQTLRAQNLHTVCEEASCPNVAECWGTGTATIMIMGDVCTRGCRFCDVNSGKPLPLDSEEPQRVAKAIKEWGLRYVVITSVCRDDLEDGGAEHFAKTIKCIKSLCPKIIVEPLIPDFKGNVDSITKILDSKPEVIGHNIETVRRLTSKVRDIRATYEQSLFVLKKIKEINPSVFTKSSIMLGHGETEEEIFKTIIDLKSVGVDILTIGQYLQPSLKHLPVQEFITPQKFALYKKILSQMGFLYTAVGPFVRSSYKAADFIEKLNR